MDRDNIWRCGQLSATDCAGCDCSSVIDGGTFCYDRGPAGFVTFTEMYPGTTYICRVNAINSNGSGTQSAPAFLTTPDAVPGNIDPNQITCSGSCAKTTRYVYLPRTDPRGIHTGRSLCIYTNTARVRLVGGSTGSTVKSVLLLCAQRYTGDAALVAAATERQLQYAQRLPMVALQR